MKKILLTVLMILTAFAVYAADFDIRVIDVESDRITIAIPLQVGGSKNFSIYVDGEFSRSTVGLTSRFKSDGTSSTGTVKYSGSQIQHFLYATELGASPAYTSATLTITPKPLANESILDRDVWAHINDKAIFQSWRVSVSPTIDVVNTSWDDYGIAITEIIVGGAEIGNVVVKIDGVAIRYYHYKSDSTSGQIFSTKLIVQRGETFEVELLAGNTGFHTVSITAEKLP